MSLDIDFYPLKVKWPQLRTVVRLKQQEEESGFFFSWSQEELAEPIDGQE